MVVKVRGGYSACYRTENYLHLGFSLDSGGKQCDDGELGNVSLSAMEQATLDWSGVQYHKGSTLVLRIIRMLIQICRFATRQ